MKIHVKEKVSRTTNCAKGTHTFIVSAWKKSGDKEVCTSLICQHCLMQVDKQDCEIMMLDYTNEIITKKQRAELKKT